jgi:hypothetical protein
MRYLLFPLLLLLAVGAVAATGAADSTDEAKQTLRKAIGLILQADGPGASELLSSIPAAELGDKDSQFRTCALSRLEGQAPIAPVASSGMEDTDEFTTQALALYRAYWHESLRGPDSRADAEKKLLAGLGTLLGGAPPGNMDEVEPLLAARLQKSGFHSQEGKTGVLRDLMIWAKQEERSERVTLPETTTFTKVFYLDAFVSRGWSSYFACDRVGTGGWTTNEGLYVIVPSYASLTDEKFRVNFLDHESQHFVDKRRFPGLAAWELEYRAKLVELAYAEDTKDRVIQSFIGNQGDDPQDPHSYADKRLLVALRARLGLTTDAELLSVPIKTLHRAAVAELRADSARRMQAGNKPPA